MSSSLHVEEEISKPRTEGQVGEEGGMERIPSTGNGMCRDPGMIAPFVCGLYIFQHDKSFQREEGNLRTGSLGLCGS